MPELISTRIQGFDDFLNGGLSKGDCVLLIAPPKIESHLFCLEYIYRGCIFNEPGLVITTNYSPENLKEKAKQFNWNFEKMEEKGMLKWIDAYSSTSRQYIESTPTIKRIGSNMPLSDISVEISNAQEYFKKTKGYYRFVFDSLSTVLMRYEINAIHDFMRDIIFKLRAFNDVGFFILGRGMHPFDVEMTLRHMMDGTIQIDENLKIEVLSLSVPSIEGTAQLKLNKEGFKVEKNVY